MDATAFLDLILPEEKDGLRCAFVLPAKRNYFFGTNAELAVFIAQMDAAGSTVYHACAAYKNNSSRRAENVSFAACLWADIDVGPGKPFASTQDALSALDAACAAARLPPPLVVCSGRGLHVYWPLQLPLELVAFKRLARGLRSALRHAGLEIDPGRTVDAASILRPPGTTHRKAEPLPVYVVRPLDEPYPNQLFDFLLKDTRDETLQTIGKHFAAPAWLANRNVPSHLRDPATYVGQQPAAYLAIVADRCEQVRRLRDWRVYKELPEPVWNLVCGVAHFCADGAERVHSWSDGHNAYVPEQTQAKIDSKAVLSGAPTCQAFHDQAPEICERCPLYTKINSPIALGYADNRKVHAAVPNVVRISQGGAAHGTPTQEACPDTLPEGYFWHGDSLVFSVGKPDGTNDNLLVSKYPIYVQKVNEGETRGDFTITFRQWLPAKGWFTIAVPAKALLGPQGMGELAQRGANVHHTEHFLRYCKHQIDEIHARGKIEVTYEQYGWKDGNTTFLYGDRLYTKDGPQEAAVNSELHTRNKWIGPGCNVTRNAESYGLAVWQNAANRLFSKGCEAQSVAILASFASCFMRFIVTDEGGAILSFVTRDSGKGKTTALAGAFSVWGDRQGLSITSDDNKVTKSLSLGALGNLPLIHDELTAKDPVVLRDFVMMFTNGRDKMRATRDGQIRHATATWQTLMLTASNASLVDALSGELESDAPAFRVLEFPVEYSPHLAEQGDKLKQQMIDNAGFAGDAFARYIVNPEVLEFIKRAVPAYMKDIYTRTGCENKHRFWVRSAACICTAALIVHKLKLLEFDPNRIIDWLVHYITPTNLTTDPLTAHTPKDWASEALSQFLMIEGVNFLVLPKEWRYGQAQMYPIREPRYQIAGTYSVAEKRLHVAFSKIRAFAMEYSIPLREWIMELQRRGAVGEVIRHNLSAGTDIPGSMTNVLMFDLSHATLAGIGTTFAITPRADPTNVTPLRR